jgi:hypothetical protein
MSPIGDLMKDHVKAAGLDRRCLLLAGVGAALAACAGGGPEIVPDGAAYAPWRNCWGGAAEGPRAPVRAAILSANAHDTQPWLFGVEEGAVTLYADPQRNLGAMDPFRREMHISLGCALENLCLAAAARGLAPQTEALPGDVRGAIGASAPRPVARVRLGPGDVTASSLAAAIPHRHTNRGPYEPRPVPAEQLAVLSALAARTPEVRLLLIIDKGAQRAFAQATVAATEAIIADAAMIADSDAWFRGSAADIEAHRDGPTIAAAGLSPTLRFLASIMPAPSPERSHAYWLKQTRDVQLATAAVFGLLLVRDLCDVPQALAAGRLWQRLHLQATLLGLAMQPLNQLPERVDRERMLGTAADTAKEFAALAATPGWYPTFAFRSGWPEQAAVASPRRDLAAVLLPQT